MDQYLYRSYVEDINNVTPELFFDLPVLHSFKSKPLFPKRIVVSDVLETIEWYGILEDEEFADLIMKDQFVYVLDVGKVIKETRTRTRYYENGGAGLTRVYITSTEYS